MCIVTEISTARKRRSEQEKRVADALVARERRVKRHEEAMQAVEDFFDWPRPDGAA